MASAAASSSSSSAAAATEPQPPLQFDISGEGFQITPEILKQMETTHGVSASPPNPKGQVGRPRKHMETDSTAVKRVQIEEVPLSHPKSKAKTNEETPTPAAAKSKAAAVKSKSAAVKSKAAAVKSKALEEMEVDKSDTKRQGSEKDEKAEQTEKTTRRKTKKGDEVVNISNPPPQESSSIFVKSDNESKPSATASSSSASAPPATVKKTMLKKHETTDTQLSPSRIGIQKLREELENAKNKNKLSVQDTSAYMKLYDDWKGAKGDKAMKDDKLKGLRDIYKRVLYKK
jgi:hypothetical protein